MMVVLMFVVILGGSGGNNVGVVLRLELFGTASWRVSVFVAVVMMSVRVLVWMVVGMPVMLYWRSWIDTRWFGMGGMMRVSVML